MLILLVAGPIGDDHAYPTQGVALRSEMLDERLELKRHGRG
jgi:hypothetical protein